MVRIAPIKLVFNPKTLWFDAGELALSAGDDVIVETARGREFGTLSGPVFQMDEEEVKKLNSPLKPVIRLATEEDEAVKEERAEASLAAMPLYRRLAEESVPDMNPVAVEYLFDGDKAVFYFESEERVDFRDLVRKLAAEFHVRIDMKQIGVRDSARMIGGLGHCGQELCCRRLGGDFNPVSIRMAKEQDLSLNPSKISGLCGRLMCCLRYEYDAYKDFHSRAPKKNAKIATPDGEGKVVDLDVPREIISIKVGDEKPVKVPLADFEPIDEGTRPNTVGPEAWEAANEPEPFVTDSAFGLFANQLTGEDQLAQPGKVRHVHDEEPERPQTRSKSRRRGGSASSRSRGEESGEQSSSRRPRRRRSTTVVTEGETQAQKRQEQHAQAQQKQQSESQSKGVSRRRSRSKSGSKAAAEKQAASEKPKNVQVGRKSSGLRGGRQETANASGGGNAANNEAEGRKASAGGRRRRRSHKTSAEGAQKPEQ